MQQLNEIRPITIDHKNGQTRILKPIEWEALVSVIPKQRLKTICKVALLTGMRWSELELLLQNPQWFDGDFIEIPTVKKLRTYNKRWVRLSTIGKELLPYFFEIAGKQGSNKKELPTWQVMGRNLRRWAERAGLNTTGISVKTFRKSWESWLIRSYPHLESLVAESQGHSRIVSIKYYRRLPFNAEDFEMMKLYVHGWDF